MIHSLSLSLSPLLRTYHSILVLISWLCCFVSAVDLDIFFLLTFPFCLKTVIISDRNGQLLYVLHVLVHAFKETWNLAWENKINQSTKANSVKKLRCQFKRLLQFYQFGDSWCILKGDLHMSPDLNLMVNDFL